MTATNERAAHAAGASLDLFGHLLGHGERLLGQASRDGRRVAVDAQALYRQAALGAVRISDAIRGVPRLMRIVRDVGLVVGSYRVERARSAHIDPAERALALTELHHRNAERVHRMCIDLGAGVLKIGQFLSCRADLLPAPYIDALSRLRDRVPPIQFEAIMGVLERELGAGAFASVDAEPVATASLAQVHRARLPDGTQVAVKVRLPGLEQRVAVDAAALTIACRAFADSLPGTDLDTIASELMRAVAEELDFAAEADNLERARAQLGEDDRAEVPRVHRSHCSPEVLTMDFVAGRSLGEYLDDAGPDQRTAILTTLVDILCAQVLRHGQFHGDPHPGNFLVTSGDRLALLDFGCVGRLDPEVRAAYAEAALAAVTGRREHLVHVLGRLGFVGAPDALAAAAALLMDAFRDPDALRRMADDPVRTLTEGLANLRAAPIDRIPHHFVLLGRVFGAVGGLLLHYRPTIDLPATLMVHLAGAMPAR